jgi:GNAT superfamily N-acetyltransferase
MVDDFVRGHPAETHPRPLEKLRDAYFGAEPIARVLVAVREGRVVGMGQWTRIYDMFWAKYGGHIEWLYVRPEARGLGISPAIVAAICADVRDRGGEYLHGTYDDALATLYERTAVGSASRTCHLSGEAFQVFADLAGEPAREIVRRLPPPALSRMPARPRS